jgi:hypothetical protein
MPGWGERRLPPRLSWRKGSIRIRGVTEATPTAENRPFSDRSSEAVVNNPFFPGTNYPQTLKQTWRLLTYPFKLPPWTTVLTLPTRRLEPRYPWREDAMRG